MENLKISEIKQQVYVRKNEDVKLKDVVEILKWFSMDLKGAEIPKEKMLFSVLFNPLMKDYQACRKAYIDNNISLEAFQISVVEILNKDEVKPLHEKAMRILKLKEKMEEERIEEEEEAI